MIEYAFRHADVDDGDVWLELADGLEERLAVADLRDGLEAGLDEQAGDALPQEDGVVGEDDPERHTASASARIAGPDSSSLGRKPSARLVVRRGPYSVASRLDVSTT